MKLTDSTYAGKILRNLFEESQQIIKIYNDILLRMLK